jgi:transcriptional regulator with XRE-family HTH domain
MKLSEKIKTARDEAGLSQSQLAALVQCSSRSISLWETTDRKPDFVFLERIARATRKPLDFFADEVIA